MNQQLYNSAEQLTVLQSNIEIKLEEQVVLNIIEANRKFPDNEWSGICFYNIENPNDDLTSYKINVVGFVPLHVGSKTSTEFNFDNKHIMYMLENGLDDCHFGHIHSHNTMDVFFSGVDNSDLVNSSPNYFMLLSLIVNNKLEFKARIAQKVTIEETITSKTLTGNKSHSGGLKEKVYAYEATVITNLKKDENFLLALNSLTLPVAPTFNTLITTTGTARTNLPTYGQQLSLPLQKTGQKSLEITGGKVNILEFIQQSIFEDYSFKTLDQVIQDWDYTEAGPIDWGYIWEDYCDTISSSDKTRTSQNKYLEFLNLVDNKLRNTIHSNKPDVTMLLKTLKKEIDECQSL